MLKKLLSVCVISVICGINAQYDLGEICSTDEGRSGVCKYEQTCKYAIELMSKEIHPTECGYEGRTMIVCCPEDYTTGIFSRFFDGTEGVITNNNLTCHYDGYLPMMCCPTDKNPEQPAEPQGCPPLPVVPTPTFDYPAHTVAWEQCVANERFVQTCVGNTRYYDCAIPITSQRVTGGEPALPMEFPHMAVLGVDSGISTENEILWVGGGSLISSKFILTAGHVLISSFGKLRYAFLGTLDKTDIRSGELYGIIQLIPHKLYSSDKKEYDIALVELNRPVIFSKFIRPICLPVPGIGPESDIRLIAGWGQTGYKNQSTNLLQKAIISVIDGNECKAILKWPGFVWDDRSMICARGRLDRFGMTDSCQGDSGGPLMYKVRNAAFSCNYVVDGVVSWGGVCGRGQASSYTRVSEYLDWIVETVWPEEYMAATIESIFGPTSN